MSETKKRLIKFILIIYPNVRGWDFESLCKLSEDDLVKIVQSSF